MGPRQHRDGLRVSDEGQSGPSRRHRGNWEAGLVGHETQDGEDDEAGEYARAAVEDGHQDRVAGGESFGVLCKIMGFRK